MIAASAAGGFNITNVESVMSYTAMAMARNPFCHLREGFTILRPFFVRSSHVSTFYGSKDRALSNGALKSYSSPPP